MDREQLERNAEAQRAFFDGKAAGWRESCPLTQREIQSFLSVVPLKEGDRVLDVACGSGVLDGCLLSMGLRVDAVDLSEKMIEKAKRNECNALVNYIAADFYAYSGDSAYDCLLVFDAYPHFPDKRLFAKKAFELLKENGTLWIFFDQGREEINRRHSDGAEEVSVPLEGAEKEAEVFRSLFEILFLLDVKNRYTIGLKKRKKESYKILHFKKKSV